MAGSTRHWIGCLGSHNSEIEKGADKVNSERIEPYEIVRTNSGERLLLPYMESAYEGIDRAVKQEDLKKDGTPKVYGRNIYVRTGPGSSFHNTLKYGDVVRYDPAKEALADPIRAEIAQLHRELEEAKSRLLGVYDDHPSV